MTAETVALYCAIGAAGAMMPLVLYLAAPSRTTIWLERLRGWLGRHEANVLVAVGLVIGALFLTEGRLR